MTAVSASGDLGEKRPFHLTAYGRILEAARSLFLKHGYETVGIDDIARVANASKATIYKKFKDKEGLLRSVIVDEIHRCDERIAWAELADMDVASALSRVAKTYDASLACDGGLDFIRPLVEWRDKASDDGAALRIDIGHGIVGKLAEYLGGAHDRRRLLVPDPWTSALVFLGCVRGAALGRALWCCGEPALGGGSGRYIESAVAVFVEGHRVRGAGAR